jgi:threonine dehydratase
VVKAPHTGYDEVKAYGLAMAEKTGQLWVPPFEDVYAQAGNGGTLAMEIFEDLSKLDAVVVPCGGGGLAVGLGVAARKLSPRTKVIAVNVDASPAMALSWKEGRAVEHPERRSSWAEALQGGVTQRTYDLAKKVVDEVVVVPESTLKGVIAELLRRHRMVVEGSAAVVLAAATQGLLPKGLKRACLVLTGANIDAARVKDVVHHHLPA